MNMNSTKILFMNTMMIGVMVSTSSNNWINMWMGMEIGVLSLIPMMTMEKISSDSPIKYFIIQSISSSMMIMSIMISTKNLLMMSMLIKIGSSPFHVWMLSMIEGLNYSNMFLLLTLIKIPGMMILSMLNESFKIWSVMSMVVGATMGINQSSIKKILTYSSIYNMGMLLSTMNENQIWINYMITYSIMLMMMTKLLENFKLMYMNQFMLNSKDPILKTSIWVMLMSMAGLPPMMGFSMKIMIIQMMIMKEEMLMCSILMLSSMIMMFLYMRISFTSIMMQSMSMKWLKTKESNMSIMIMVLNLLLTPMMLTLKSLN